jgi:hypothetical protein
MDAAQKAARRQLHGALADGYMRAWQRRVTAPRKFREIVNYRWLLGSIIDDNGRIDADRDAPMKEFITARDWMDRDHDSGWGLAVWLDAEQVRELVRTTMASWRQR